MDTADINDCHYFNEKGEDKRLLNWRKWMNIRRKFHERMYTIQHRRPSELVLNKAEDLVMINNERLLYEYCRIPRVTSNRGKPSFWYLPPASKKYPSLISVMPKTMDYEVPERTLIAVPPQIRREKNILTSEKQKMSRWFVNKYLAHKNYALQEQILYIEPHFPQIVHLIVFGSPCLIREENFISLNNLDEAKEIQPITYNDNNVVIATNLSSTSSTTQSEKILTKSLQIENTVFTAGTAQEANKYYVFINYEIGKHDIICKKIILKNTGDVALRYHWFYKQQINMLPDLIPLRLPRCYFIFTKNKSIILPGKFQVMDIYFKTLKAGVYKEEWELITEPNIFEENGSFHLILQACADIANFAEAEAEIVQKIDEGVKFKTAGDTLIDIITRVAVEVDDKQTSTKKISEKDIFEAINAKFGPPGSLPEIYYYNEALVKELKKLYNKCKSEFDPENWSYKLEDVNEVINNCPDFEKRNLCKLSYTHLVNNIFKTNLIRNKKQHTLQNMYLLLCVMIDQMTEKVYALRDKYKIPYAEIYPGADTYLLKEQEFYYNNYRDSMFMPDMGLENIIHRIEECTKNEFQQPQLEALKKVPFADTEQRYKLYFKEKYGKIIADGKKDRKKDNKSVKTDVKENTKGKTKEKAAKPKLSIRKNSDVRERYSILKRKSLADLQIDRVIVSSEYEPGEFVEPTTEDMKMYYNELYINLYSILSETIQGIEDFYQYFYATETISHKTLKRCLELGFPITPAPPKVKYSRNDFKEILAHIGSLSNLSTPQSIIESKSEFLSDVSNSHSDYDYFQQLPSYVSLEEHEMCEAGTQTYGGELYPKNTQSDVAQTDGYDDFDLIAQIERELSATSVQFIVQATEDKFTQTPRIDPVIEYSIHELGGE